MRPLFFIFILAFGNASFAQNSGSRQSAIDAEVNMIRSQKTAASTRFSTQALTKVLHHIKYEYLENNQRYLRINRQFFLKNDSIQQTFYFKGGELIFATEVIISYFDDGKTTDSISWSGEYYFDKSKLIDYTTLGHGKSELDSWNPEVEILEALQESKRDIARYKRKKNGD
jgi:hypothetical protein